MKFNNIFERGFKPVTDILYSKSFIKMDFR